MQSTILLLAGGLLAVAVYGDLRARRIPNELSLGIAVLAVLRMVVAGDSVAAAYTAATGTAVFAIGYILFLCRVVGGGDVKLAAATALLVGSHDAVAFLIVMSLVGGAISLAMLLKFTLTQRARATAMAGGPAGADTPSPVPRPTVPYGVAIAVAGIWILFLQAFHLG